MRINLILYALPAAAFTFLATACTREASQSEPTAAASELESAAADEPAIPENVHLTPAAIAEAGITTWKIQPVDLEHLLTLNGTVGYNENRLLQVAANIRGRVTAIPVDLGARVRRGDPLVVIESVDLGRAREDLIRALAELFAAAIDALAPTRLVGRVLSRRGSAIVLRGPRAAVARLPTARGVVIVGAGKGAAGLAAAVEGSLAPEVLAGLVVVPPGYERPLRRVTLAVAGHPLPDRRGITATRRLMWRTIDRSWAMNR